MSKNSRTPQLLSLRCPRLAVIAAFAVVAASLPFVDLRAATLSSASVSVGDPRPSTVNAAYTLTASGVTLTAIKCVKVVFSTTSSGTTIPTGMSTTSANLDTASSNYIPTPASWTIARPANGTLQITNASGETPASATNRRLAFTGITNSSDADTKFFAKYTSYTNTDCATGPVDNVQPLFILTYGSTLTMNVDATLSFTVNAVAAGSSCNGATTTAASTSTSIPFGTVNSASNAVVCQDLQAATNATNGYTVYARYTAQPTNSLGQSIANWTGSNTTPTTFAAAGTEAYGYTTDDAALNNSGGAPTRFIANKWAAMSTTNAEIGYEGTGVSSATYRVGHEVGVANTTRPGTYQTTIIYTCTPLY